MFGILIIVVNWALKFGVGYLMHLLAGYLGLPMWMEITMIAVAASDTKVVPHVKYG